ncbi:MAG: hypothetical protein ABIO63_05960 [Casimicrobiaceae bacterium]
MNKLIVALIAGVFASVAAAQTAPAPLTTKEKQDAVKGASAGNPNNSGGVANTDKMQKETTAASKGVAKTTSAEKKAAVKSTDKGLVNPNNPTGAGGTATMQKETTAASAGTPKANTEIKTKEGQKALDKELTQKATK